jgi:polyhydroxybutyrate depolymerase
VVAAAAMVSFTAPANCPKGTTPAVLAIHGTADASVPYGGGVISGSTTVVPPAPAVIKGYADRSGCDPVAVQDQPAAGVQRTHYARCAGGADVVLDTVVGGTHPWPGGTVAARDRTDSAAGKSFAATEAILDFFDAHRAPAERG